MRARWLRQSLPLPLPVSSMEVQRLLSDARSGPAAVVEVSSTLWTGRAMVRRRGRGFRRGIILARTSSLASTIITLISPHGLLHHLEVHVRQSLLCPGLLPLWKGTIRLWGVLVPPFLFPHPPTRLGGSV